MDEDHRQPHRFSRYVQRFHVVDTTQDARIVEHLLRLGRQTGRRMALFITRDQSVPLISQHRDALGEYFDFTLPPRTVVRDLMHKERLGRFLDAAHCRHPRTVAVRAETLAEAAAAVGFPCVLKPTTRSERFKASIAHASADLRAQYDAASQHCPECIVQQWIPGADSDVHFAFVYIDRGGAAGGVFVGRKLHQYPRGTGIAAEAEGYDDDFVRQETLRLFESVGYQGFGSSEFRRDPESGTYYLIEFTVGRTDYNVACATANGVDLPWIGYQDTVALGRPRPVLTQTGNRRWVDVRRTVRAIAEERRETGGSRYGMAARMARCFWPGNTFTLFDVRDPAPFAAQVLGSAIRFAARAPRAVTRRVWRGPKAARLGGAECRE